MSPEELGIQTSYWVIGNEQRHVPRGTVDALRSVLEGFEAGAAPIERGQAYLPPTLDERGKAWGLAVQLYALRSERNWGVGDFTDLAAVMRWAASLGATYVGVNPLHALPYADPGRRSPYYPSSRLFLNVFAIDPDAVAVGDEAVDLRSDEARRRIAAAREGDTIDYHAVAAAKKPAFDALWEGFKVHANTARRTAFQQFREKGGEPLRRHALFEALAERFAPEHGAGFPVWPEAYRDPESDEVASFAAEAEDRVAFHGYLQWIADLQLADAAGAGVANDPPTTLYLDLAVGSAPDGSEVWSGGDVYARGMRMGCPPDPMAMAGQDWGLPPMNPRALAGRDFRPLRRVLEASMRHAGALRIDHVLGYDRQFWIPDGVGAPEGGYVAFPRDDMLAVAAEASRNARCLLVGEDLGTVPEGLTEALHAANLLSYEVARWSRDDHGAFLPADQYPRLCLAVASTHDIAPVVGWAKGQDIRDRAAIESWSEDELARVLAEREGEVRGLCALWGADPNGSPRDMVAAAHRFLAATNAAVVMATLEDVLLQEPQVNMPGTTDEHPNWRLRYARDLEDWTKDEEVRELTRAAAR